MIMHGDISWLDMAKRHAIGLGDDYVSEWLHTLPPGYIPDVTVWDTCFKGTFNAS